MLFDLLSTLVRFSGKTSFPGKRRLIPACLKSARGLRVRDLPRGGKILCDLTVPYECMIWLKQEEPEDLVALQSLLQAGDVFVDCGANVGLWTLIAAGVVGANGHVLAYEPQPIAFSRLLRNIRLSGFAHVSAFELAVSNMESTMRLRLDREHNRTSQASSLQGLSESFEVTTTCLDTSLANHPAKVTGIKIDVEGHEMAVLQGSELVLKQDRPFVCIEFNRELSGASSLGNWDAHRFLSTLDYKPVLMSRIPGQKQRCLPESYCPSYYSNLLYVPLGTDVCQRVLQVS